MHESSAGLAPLRRVLWRATIYFVGWVAASTLWLGLCYAAPDFPPLTGRVVDQTGMLNAQQSGDISNKLATLEQQSGIQIVVAILRSLDGMEIRDYGYQLGRHWQLGQKDKDNGILLLIVPSQNQVSIEVGYGLEGVLTDATSRLIIENAIVPAFRQGRFEEGINAAIRDISTVIAGGTPESARRDAVGDDREFGSDDILPLLFMLVVMFLIIHASRGGGAAGHRRRRAMVPIIWGSGGFGGGFGGGGFGGGFSGGGGSFGGGGASGRW